MPNNKLLTTALLFLLANIAYAALPLQRNTLYSCSNQSNSTLYALNTSGVATRVGAIGTQCTDLAFVGSQLWGISFTRIMTINATTGAVTASGLHGLTDLNALIRASSSGTVFYSAGFRSGQFVRITISSAGQISTRILGSFGSGLTSSGDFEFVNGTLYATVNRPGFSNTWLARINPTNGRATLVGDIGFPTVFGLALRSGVLYAVTANGNFLRINTATGRGVRLGTDGIVHAGLAKSP